MSLSSLNPNPTDPNLTPSLNPDGSGLRDRLLAESEKNQLHLLQQLSTLTETDRASLMEFLLERQNISAQLIDGKVVQMLWQFDPSRTEAFLETHFPKGRVALPSDLILDYAPLQHLLLQQAYQQADRLTLSNLCELAGATAAKRGWLYFTEVENFPTADLQAINRLWQIYSEGKFGFSVQRELWISVDRNWDKLWSKIGWRKGNTWTRYPQEFIWDLSAPRGHLPLSNQLRGVRVIAALLAHPAWNETAAP